MENNQSVQLVVHNHVGIISLNRPNNGNALNKELAEDLLKVAVECSSNEEIRAVILTGSGDNFCFGGDLKSFVKEGEQIEKHIKEVTSSLNHAISHLVRMKKPVIGAVKGVAAGGGMSLIFASDILYASENARFVTAYNKIGLTPDLSGSYFLPRMVGIKRALELMYTNRLLTAQEAYEWGIVNQVVRDDELMGVVIQLAENLAQGPIEAFGETKSLLYSSFDQTLESQMQIEAITIAKRAMSEEGQEGLIAFIEKREPKFFK